MASYKAHILNDFNVEKFDPPVVIPFVDFAIPGAGEFRRTADIIPTYKFDPLKLDNPANYLVSIGVKFKDFGVSWTDTDSVWLNVVLTFDDPSYEPYYVQKLYEVPTIIDVLQLNMMTLMTIPHKSSIQATIAQESSSVQFIEPDYNTYFNVSKQVGSAYKVTLSESYSPDPGIYSPIKFDTMVISSSGSRDVNGEFNTDTYAFYPKKSLVHGKFLTSYSYLVMCNIMFSELQPFAIGDEIGLRFRAWDPVTKEYITVAEKLWKLSYEILRKLSMSLETIVTLPYGSHLVAEVFYSTGIPDHDLVVLKEANMDKESTNFTVVSLESSVY
mgnify:CR=1 FL=1